MNKTKIEWTDMTWNPITGCKRGCNYCYAERIYRRFHRSFEPTFHQKRLSQPLRRKIAQKIFVCSVSDLMASWTPIEWIEEVFSVIHKTPQHTYQLLTKSPERYIEFSPFPDNCWIGATATDQSMADKAINVFEKCEAKVKYLSCEPLLGEINPGPNGFINWLIIGAQTGPNSNQPKKEWVQILTNYARRNNVALFYKPNLKGYDIIREFPK